MVNLNIREPQDCPLGGQFVGILISRYIVHPGCNNFLVYVCLHNSEWSKINIRFFWDQLNSSKKVTNSANSQLSS